MQIKYDAEKDILFVDFADKMVQFEKKARDPVDGFAVFSAGKGKNRGIVIYPASKWLPKGFMDKIEKVD